MAHFGIDVSSNDSRPPNYQQVVNTLRSWGSGAQPFVIVKINEATGYVNPYASADVNGYRSAGAAVAGYLFDHGTSDPGAEVALYRQAAGNLPQTDDMEDPQGVNYVSHTQQLINLNPNALVYLNQSEVAEGIPTGHGLWLAQYDYNPTAPPRYPCVIKQYHDNGSVSGIPGGPVDLNIWLGSESFFESFFAGTVPAAPPPPVSHLFFLEASS